ncbi:hypothetical protein GH714_020976 [Hevea brasiliensis]|uniref:TF-B3 domain-containing protein n=1 Tax=Hevea brasiliensis TaxID=3981 RepID=A0A6A6MN53_HEVBR|nr:hypothetical protein GH714_020976 [Hevea brasiliensis]
MAIKYGFYFIVEGNTKRIEIPNHVIEMLDVFKFDMVTLSIKGLEGHSWRVAVGVDNGDGKFYLQDGVAELIKHYKLKEKFCIVFKAISESVLEILMFDKSGAKIDYGNPPI